MSDEVFNLVSVAAHIVRDVTLFLDAPAAITSAEIAELVKARHDNVKRAVDRLVSRGVIEFPPTEEIKTATKPTLNYVFRGEKGKRDSIVVMAQLSPELTGALVDRWIHLEGEVRTVQTQLMEKALTKQIASTLTNLRDAADLMNKTQGSKTFPQKAKGIHELLEKLRRACSNDFGPDEAEDLYQRVSEGLVRLGVAKQDGGLKAQAFVTKLSDVLRLYGREVALSYARTSATGQAEP